MPQLTATITAIRFPSTPTLDPETWYILATDKGACKGNLQFRPQPGDTLTLEGKHTEYKGERQFAFVSAVLNMPTNPRDELHYVCTRTTGCGDAMESLIWGFAGERWKDIKSGVVARLNGKLFDAFMEQIALLAEKQGEADVIAALIGRGCTQNMAQKAYAAWKGETLGVINSNCYRIADLDGYSFNDVDRMVRPHYGIKDTDPRRVKAAIVHSLRRLTTDGDTVIMWEALLKETTRMLGGHGELVTACTRELFAEGDLVALPDCGAVALRFDYECESEIWRFAGLVKREDEK